MSLRKSLETSSSKKILLFFNQIFEKKNFNLFLIFQRRKLLFLQLLHKKNQPSSKIYRVQGASPLQEPYQIIISINSQRKTNMQYDTVSQSQSSATRAKKRNVFTPEGDEALKQILESGEIARVGYKKGWILCAKIMRQKYGIYCTDRNCRERFKYSLDPSLKEDQNQWNDEEVEYIINLVEKYGPDISVIAEAMEGRTGVSVRNCVTNQLRKAIRYLEQLLQTQLKVEVDKIESKDLIKLGGILVAQAPNTVDRTQNLRQRLIAMWKMIDKTQKPSHTDLIQSYRELMGVRKEFLPQRPKKTEPQKIIDPAKQRRRLVKMQKKERTRKKKQQKQSETSLKQQEVHKLKIRKEAEQKRQREQSLLKLQKTMEKKVKQNNQIATPNIFEQEQL